MIEAISNDSDFVVNPYSHNLKWPCSICNKNVTSSMKGIQCDKCNKWSHIKCNGISPDEYHNLILDESSSWFCLFCNITFNYENFAFTLANNDEIRKINECDSLNGLHCFPDSHCILTYEQFSNQIDNSSDLLN